MHTGVFLIKCFTWSWLFALNPSELPLWIVKGKLIFGKRLCKDFCWVKLAKWTEHKFQDVQNKTAHRQQNPRGCPYHCCNRQYTQPLKNARLASQWHVSIHGQAKDFKAFVQSMPSLRKTITDLDIWRFLFNWKQIESWSWSRCSTPGVLT